MKEKRNRRTRNYGTVVYPESAPDNWLQILSDKKIPAFVSPLHENDIDPQNQPKKPHYHVMIMFDSVKTSEQAKEVFECIGGVGLEVVESVRGYARYLCHLDNPEKAQYEPLEVKCFGAADYLQVIGLASDKYKAIGEMMDFCIENKIMSYAKLLYICRLEHYNWFKVLCDSGTLVMEKFLKSYKWTYELGEDVDYNPETGEIVENSVDIPIYSTNDSFANRWSYKTIDIINIIHLKNKCSGEILV